MSLKTKLPDKMFIEQFIINGASDLAKWSEDNLTILLEENFIIGYYFAIKHSTSFGEDIEILNIYLINSRHYHSKEVIGLDELEDAWERFKNTKEMVFANPPIDVWMDSKQEWCNKVSHELCKTFNCCFEDALSTTYYAIMKCYNKPNVYMGNLNYIHRAVINTYLVDYRYNKRRVNQDSGLAVSLSTIVNSADDDNEKITLESCIAAPKPTDENTLDYKDLLESSVKLLSDTFTQREIDLILTQKCMYLPRNIYNRLVRWRQKHSIRELYENETD